MSNLQSAINVFNEYYACPCCSKGKDPVNLAAVYHQSAFDSRRYTCKDCGKEFLIPQEVKISKPAHFVKKPRS